MCNKKCVNLSNDAMFGMVMENEEYCRKMLEILLGMKLSKLTIIPQKWLKDGLDTKAIRLDILAYDAEKNAYDVEVQTYAMDDFAKRTRMYQAYIDRTALRTGEDYKMMRSTYIIFICTFDPFNRGRWKYTIVPRCIEEDIDFDTAQQWIYFNTKGYRGDISEEAVELLRFIESSTPENANDGYLKKLLSTMEEYMVDSRRRDIIMYFEDKLTLAQQAGLKEGIKRGLDQGMLQKSVRLILNKRGRGLDAAEIADIVEEDVGFVSRVFALDDEGKNENEIIDFLMQM